MSRTMANLGYLLVAGFLIVTGTRTPIASVVHAQEDHGHGAVQDGMDANAIAAHVDAGLVSLESLDRPGYRRDSWGAPSCVEAGT